MREGRVGTIGHIDLARAQPFDEVSRLDVDQLDEVGIIEDAIGNTLSHVDVGDRRYLIVKRLEMLHVHGGEHADARAQKLLYVLIALAVPASGSVGVRKLVDEHDLRPAGQRGVEIELLERDAAMRPSARAMVSERVWGSR